MQYGRDCASSSSLLPTEYDFLCGQLSLFEKVLQSAAATKLSLLNKAAATVNRRNETVSARTASSIAYAVEDFLGEHRTTVANFAHINLKAKYSI